MTFDIEDCLIRVMAAFASESDFAEGAYTPSYWIFAHQGPIVGTITTDLSECSFEWARQFEVSSSGHIKLLGPLPALESCLCFFHGINALDLDPKFPFRFPVHNLESALGLNLRICSKHRAYMQYLLQLS